MEAAGGDSRMIKINVVDGTLVQNNYIHDSEIIFGQDNEGVQVTGSASDNIIVNNEIKDTSKGIALKPSLIASVVDGTIIENNDIYLTTARHSDCSGNYTTAGPCAAGKNGISQKVAGNSANPVIIIQNRVWGFRRTDRDLCCRSTTPGDGISISQDPNVGNSGADYSAMMNNIFMDLQNGNQTPRDGPDHTSFIGNILYNIQQFSTASNSFAMNLRTADNTEWYLNTIVDANSWINVTNTTDAEAYCNVAIVSGARSGSTPHESQVIDLNSFYGTPVYTVNGTATNIDKSSMTTHVTSNNYALGDTVREGNNIHIVTTDSGSSGGSAPTWGTTLGSTTSDSGITWTMIRTGYTFWRKLISAPEQVTIPYVESLNTSDNPDYNNCANTIGSTTDLGIDNVSASGEGAW